MKRFSPSERAKHRYYVRQYTAIWNEGFDTILAATAVEYRNTAEAFQAFATAARDATRQIVSDIIGEFLKERIIRPLLGEIPVTEELSGCAVTFRPEGSR